MLSDRRRAVQEEAAAGPSILLSILFIRFTSRVSDPHPVVFRSVSSRPRDLIEVVRRGTSSIVVAASIREQAKHRENRTRTSGRIAVPSGSSRTRHLCNMHGSRIIQEHVLLVFSHQESSIALCCVACSPGRWPPIEGPGPLLAGISPSGCMDGQCLKRNHHHIAYSPFTPR